MSQNQLSLLNKTQLIWCDITKLECCLEDIPDVGKRYLIDRTIEKMYQTLEEMEELIKGEEDV